MKIPKFFAFTTCTALTLAGCVSETSQSEVSEEEVATTSDPLYAMNPFLWQTHYIPVCWKNPQDPVAMEWVRDAVTKSWGTAAPLKFTGWGACGSDTQGIRIQIEDPSPWGNPYSWFGNQTPPAGPTAPTMSLNFTFKKWGQSCDSSVPSHGYATHREYCIRGIAVHEFGHALGFAHEQDRLDTPQDCKEKEKESIKYDNIGYYGYNNTRTLGAYDPNSMMNYCNPKVYDGVLSAGDVAGVRAVYGNPGTLPAEDDARIFTASDYLALYGDLSAAFGTNTASARSHWLNYGRVGGRDGSVLFSSQYYMQNNADLRTVFGASNWSAGLEHFLNYGVNEGRRPSIFFDATYYLAQYADLKNAFGTNKSAAFNHWMTYGINEGRRASREFDPKYYLAVNTDVAKAFGATNYRGALIHYARYGKAEGRRCVP